MDDLDDVLARARSAYGPDPEAKQRIRGALSVAVGGAALAGAGTAKAATAKGAATLGTKAAASLGGAAKVGIAANVGMIAKLGVVAALAGGSVFAYSALENGRTEHATPMTNSVVTAAPKVEARAVTRAVPEIAAPTPTPDVAKGTEPVVLAVRPTNPLPPQKKIESNPLAPRSTLKDELSLIRRATEELRSGQPGEALATLAVHRNRFPTGSMTTEREGLGLLARCSLGRTTETRASAERFAREAGSSPLAAHVRTQCLK